MVSMGLNYLLLWQEFVTEWNLWQECWIFPFQDHVNDLRDNLCCRFSLHVTSGHCSHLICICTCHPHIIWAYAYYVHIICSESLIYSFLTDNADVIRMSSLVLFIYPIMYNLVAAQTHIVHVVCMLSAHVDIICLSSLTLLVFHYNLIPALETQRLKKSKKLG